MKTEPISPSSADGRLVAAYEELRAQAVRGWRGPGLALMISRGFRCWMEAWSQLLTSECSTAQRLDARESSVLLPGMQRDLVILLAGMLLHRVSKGIA